MIQHILGWQRENRPYTTCSYTIALRTDMSLRSFAITVLVEGDLRCD